MQDLSYLQQPRYDVAWNNTLTSAKTLTAISEVEQAKGDVKILYESIQKYEEIAGYFKILPEWKVTHIFVPSDFYKADFHIFPRSYTLCCGPQLT